MTSRPAPTRADHEKFCEEEGWEKVRDSQGRTGTHHVTYELYLADGRILRTRISHPPDRTTYGAAMWSHILRDQLSITEAEFWACVKEGVVPARGQPATAKEALPAELVHLLATRVRLSDDEIAQMTKEQAVDRLQEYWTTGS